MCNLAPIVDLLLNCHASLLQAASCKTVPPSWSTAVGAAPASSSICTIDLFPFLTARCNTVEPLYSTSIEKNGDVIRLSVPLLLRNEGVYNHDDLWQGRRHLVEGESGGRLPSSRHLCHKVQICSSMRVSGVEKPSSSKDLRNLALMLPLIVRDTYSTVVVVIPGTTQSPRVAREGEVSEEWPRQR
jgi:hypothetical protein